MITAGVEAFNIFNSQRPIAVDNNYTFDTVGPIINATQGTVAQAIWRRPAARRLVRPGNGTLPKSLLRQGRRRGSSRLPDPTQAVTAAAVNPNWGKPTQYQAVRTFRFGARLTF